MIGFPAVSNPAPAVDKLQRLQISELRVFVDLNDRDPDGFLRLNLAGTLEDLSRGRLVLEQGMPMTGVDGDLTATIIVVAPGMEGIWRGRIVDGPWEEDA